MALIAAIIVNWFWKKICDLLQILGYPRPHVGAFIAFRSALLLSFMGRKPQFIKEEDSEALLLTQAKDYELSYEIVGAGLEKMVLQIKPIKVEHRKRIGLVSGTVFRSNDPRVQTMVCVKTNYWQNEYNSPIEAEVLVGCMEMLKEVPGRSHKFSLRRAEDPMAALSEDLRKLLSLGGSLESTRWPARVRQFAIWTITDNPADRNLYAGIVNAFSSDSSGGRGKPSRIELFYIKSLFRIAGINIAKYKALQ